METIKLDPELKESKDERIRNFISNELACLRAADEKGTVRYNELTEAIAWVEKHGEQKPDDLIEESYQQQADDLIDMVTEKPAEWSEEDEQIFNVMKSELEKYIMLKQYGTPLSVYDMEWFKSLKERIRLQPQQKWSEEDEKVEPKFGVGDIIRHKDTNETFEVSRIEIFDADEIYYHLTNGGCICENSDNFERVEQNPAWSEEDEKELGRVIYMMEQLDLTESWSDCYTFLNSLRDRVQLKQG